MIENRTVMREITATSENKLPSFVIWIIPRIPRKIARLSPVDAASLSKPVFPTEHSFAATYPGMKRRKNNVKIAGTSNPKISAKNNEAEYRKRANSTAKFTVLFMFRFLSFRP